MGSAVELIKNIEFVNLFCDLTDEKIDIVLGDIETTVPKQFRERNDIAAIDDPLLGEGMTISMDACCRYPTALIIFVEHVIAGALRELLTEAITEQKVIF